MGFVAPEYVYDVDFTGTRLAGLAVKVRSMSGDHMIAMTRLMGKAEDGDAADVLDELFEKFVQILVSWNLETADGTPLPPTKETLFRQDFGRFMLPVMKMSLDAVMAVDDELGKGSASGLPSQVVSIPTEVL